VNASSQPPTHLAIPIEAASRLAAYFFETPMPRAQSDPYVEILRVAVPISLPQQAPSEPPVSSPADPPDNDTPPE